VSEHLKTINDVLGQYSNIVSAMEALSTFAAVVASLGIALWAHRANRTQLVAHIFVGNLHVDSAQPSPQFIILSITNTGTLSLWIPMSFLYWKMPFHRGMVFVMCPLDAFDVREDYVLQRSYPVEVPARCHERFFVSKPDRAESEMIGLWKTFPLRLLFFRAFINFVVVTDDGSKFKVRMSEPVRKIMTKNYLSTRIA
jgi:hypothetical protein